MDETRRRELAGLLEAKLAVPDPPHGYTARFVDDTASWIKTLDLPDRQEVFAFLGHILALPGAAPVKTRALMVLSQFPQRPAEELLDAFLAGPDRHTPGDLRLAEDIRERLYDRTLDLGRRRVILKYRQNRVLFLRQTPAASWELYATFAIPPDLPRAEQIYDLILESRRPTALIACRGDYDIAALLDEKTGQMLRWRHTK